MPHGLLLLTFMSSTMLSVMAFLYSKPPSSLKKLARKPTSTAFFWGNLRQSCLIDVTIRILNSSAMSFMKVEICFISRSTLLSSPVLSSVVIASVPIDRFESVMSASMSSLHLVTHTGYLNATSLSVRIAQKRKVGLVDDRKSCSTVMAGLRSLASTPGRLQMALAAS